MILISTHILQSRESRKRAPVLLRATSSEIPCSVQLVRQVVTSPASSKPHSISINVCRHRTNNPQHRLLNHILLYCQIILVRNAYRADNPQPLAEMRFLCLHGASTSGEVRDPALNFKHQYLTKTIDLRDPIRYGSSKANHAKAQA